MSQANAATNTRQAARLPPALNPEQPALTQPWRDFVSRGWVSSIGVTFTGGTTSVAFDLGPLVKVPDGTDRMAVPPGMAKHYIIESGLWSPANQQRAKAGVKNDGVQLPKKSLVPKDFESTTSDEELRKRTAAVAAALTDTVARGRIGSLKFMRKGVDTFEKWWLAAPSESKTRILMDQKHHLALKKGDHDRFKKVVTQCPFRGPVPTPSEEEEDKEEPPRTGKQVSQLVNGSPPRK
jgi:hypothetical protein